MIEHDVTVTLTPEDIELYDRARAINLPTIVVSMYGDRIKMLLAEEREACARVCELMWHEWLDSPEENEPNKPDAEDCYRAIRERGQA